MHDPATNVRLYVKLYPIERNDVLYILYTLEMRIAQPKRST